MKLKEDLKKWLYIIRVGFNIRVFITLFLGASLLGVNVWLFCSAVLYAFSNFSLGLIVSISAGTIGFLASGFLIVIITLYNAAIPFEQRDYRIHGSSYLAQARAGKGKNRRKKIALILTVYSLFFIAGAALLGYHFYDSAKYSGYIKTTAEVVERLSADDEGHAKSVYKYAVDKTFYFAEGKSATGGIAAASVGDRVNIKYNPSDPADVYLINEKIAIAIIGAGFIFVGIIIALFELTLAKKISSPLLVAFITLGISFLIVLGMTVSRAYSGAGEFFGKNVWLFFIGVFTNAGLLMGIEGIMGIGKKKEDRQPE